MTHVEKSLELFKSDFNCSQSVFATFSEELGLSEKQALKIGGCFGSGMRKGEVCGACTGALMALGLKYGHNEIGDTENKLLTNDKCVQFLDEFKAENGSYLCNELLKCRGGCKAELSGKFWKESCDELLEKNEIQIWNAFTRVFDWLSAYGRFY